MTAELAALTVEAARAAATYVRRMRPQGRVEVALTKSSPTDAVTRIDQATERLVRDLVLARRPDDGFLGEEDGGTAGTTGVVWVVDPIDGTVNFVYGLPGYAVSVAAEVDGEVVAGCVVDVCSGEEFTAVRGEGAYRRPGHEGVATRIRAVAPVDLSHALVGTGFSYVVGLRVQQAAAVARLLADVRDIRRIGSAAIDLCNVACGRLDAYVEQGLQAWDVAAGNLIARESGVVLAGLDGEPDRRLTMAAPEPIAAEFFDLVRRCGF